MSIKNFKQLARFVNGKTYQFLIKNTVSKEEKQVQVLAVIQKKNNFSFDKMGTRNSKDLKVYTDFNIFDDIYTPFNSSVTMVVEGVRYGLELDYFLGEEGVNSEINNFAHFKFRGSRQKD